VRLFYGPAHVAIPSNRVIPSDRWYEQRLYFKALVAIPSNRVIPSDLNRRLLHWITGLRRNPL